MTFADTLRAVRVTSRIKVNELGATGKTMRQTRSGNLLVEFGMGAKAEVGASKLQTLLASAILDKVGTIINLGTSMEIEIVDIDAIAEREEIEMALNKAIAEKTGEKSKDGGIKLSVCGR